MLSLKYRAVNPVLEQCDLSVSSLVQYVIKTKWEIPKERPWSSRFRFNVYTGVRPLILGTALLSKGCGKVPSEIYIQTAQ